MSLTSSLMDSKYLASAPNPFLNAKINGRKHGVGDIAAQKAIHSSQEQKVSVAATLASEKSKDLKYYDEHEKPAERKFSIASRSDKFDELELKIILDTHSFVETFRENYESKDVSVSNLYKLSNDIQAMNRAIKPAQSLETDYYAADFFNDSIKFTDELQVIVTDFIYKIKNTERAELDSKVSKTIYDMKQNLERRFEINTENSGGTVIYKGEGAIAVLVNLYIYTKSPKTPHIMNKKV